MTDKELIQALRNCGTHPVRCKSCPYNGVYSGVKVCVDVMKNDAADRLETLLAENERLKAQLPKWRSASEPPKTSETVFARDMVGVVTTAYYNGSWHGMLNCDAVTHWMPLPSTEGVE